EATSAATRRTAAASNPLAWQGEITAANAEAVWKFTREHINLLCAGWKTSGSNGNGRGKSSGNANGNGSGIPRFANAGIHPSAGANDSHDGQANGHGDPNGTRATDTSLLRRAEA